MVLIPYHKNLQNYPLASTQTHLWINMKIYNSNNQRNNLT